MNCLKEKVKRNKIFPGKSNNVYTGRDEQKDMLFADISDLVCRWTLSCKEYGINLLCYNNALENIFLW